MVSEANRVPFTWKDCLVIGVVWAPTIVVPWIDKWHEFLIPVYVAGRKTVDRRYVNLVIDLRLVTTGFLAVFVAFASDLLKRHYLIWSACLGIYTGAQMYGMVIYYTGPYEAADLVYWLSSFMTIGTAVQLFVIFSQNPNASRSWSHLVLGACALSTALSMYVLFWVVHNRQRALFAPLGYFQVLPWVSIVIFISLIIATRASRSYSLVGNPKSPRIRSSLKAIWWIVTNRNTRAVEFALFAAMVIAICIPIGTHHAVFHIDLNHDGSIDLDTTTEHLYLLGRVVGLIILEAVLFGMRKLNAKLSDVMSLGLPLILYLCVAIIIFLRLEKLRPLQKSATDSLEEQVQQGPVFAGPIPSEKLAVVEFYNVIDDTIEVLSSEFTLEGPLEPYSRIGVGLNVTGNVPIKVVVVDKELTATAKRDVGYGNSTECLCILSLLNRYHTYIIHGNRTNIGIFNIHDHGKIKPSIEPVLIIMNSFMDVDNDEDRVLVWEEAARVAREVAFFESFSAFSPNRSLIVNVPVGGVKVTYEDLNELDFRNPLDSSTNVIITEPFVVYTVLITLQNNRGYMDSYEVMRVNVNARTLAIPKIQNDNYVKMALALMGAAYPTLMVAFLHHFWMDFPHRLRATMLALCLVSHMATKRLIEANLKLLQPNHAFILVILMGSVVASHLILAPLYFCHFGFGYRLEQTRAPAKHKRLKHTASPQMEPPAQQSKQVTFDESAPQVVHMDQ